MRVQKYFKAFHHPARWNIIIRSISEGEKRMNETLERLREADKTFA